MPRTPIDQLSDVDWEGAHSAEPLRVEWNPAGHRGGVDAGSRRQARRRRRRIVAQGSQGFLSGRPISLQEREKEAAEASKEASSKQSPTTDLCRAQGADVPLLLVQSSKRAISQGQVFGLPSCGIPEHSLNPLRDPAQSAVFNCLIRVTTTTWLPTR